MFYIIGDVHGRIKEYHNLIRAAHLTDDKAVTFQVGDMGCCFNKQQLNCGNNDFWIGGNHDDHEYDKNQKGYLGNFGVKEINGIKFFFVRGALSIDKEYRTEGISWWKHEELNYEQMSTAICLYEHTLPDVVISHDCPNPIREKICSNHYETSLTVQGLTNMLEIWTPKKWIFGHHHKWFKHFYGNCEFTCIPELEVFTFDEKELELH